MKAVFLMDRKAGFTRSVPERLITEIQRIPGLELEIDTDWSPDAPARLAERIRQADVLILSRQPRVPDELASNPGRLKYICYLHGSVQGVLGLPIIQSRIQVTNWGDATGRGLATSSFVLLTACLNDLHRRIMAVRRGGGRGIESVGGWVDGLRIGVYGYGFAGKAFVDLALRLGAHVRVYDPFAQGVPDCCTRVNTLPELFDGIQALVIHAALTDETKGSVTAELLAKLPDQGVVVNTARGAIIDQDALFAELKSGRLRAGLDVLSPDDLPEDHEARTWENLIWTCHRFYSTGWPGEVGPPSRRDEVVLENLRNFVQGKPLNFVIDEKRYALMT